MRKSKFVCDQGYPTGHTTDTRTKTVVELILGEGESFMLLYLVTGCQVYRDYAALRIKFSIHSQWTQLVVQRPTLLCKSKNAETGKKKRRPHYTKTLDDTKLLEDGKGNSPLPVRFSILPSVPCQYTTLRTLKDPSH